MNTFLVILKRAPAIVNRCSTGDEHLVVSEPRMSKVRRREGYVPAVITIVE